MSPRDLMATGAHPAAPAESRVGDGGNSADVETTRIRGAEGIGGPHPCLKAAPKPESTGGRPVPNPPAPPVPTPPHLGAKAVHLDDLFIPICHVSDPPLPCNFGPKPVAAQGRAAGLGQRAAGEGAGGAQQVMGHGGDGQPRGVGGELPARQVGEGPVVEVGEDLLDDRVAAVVGLGLDSLERGR
jgi:hypothetical protein